MLSRLLRRWRLACRGRKKYAPADFRSSELLYRGFAVDELDDEGNLDTNTLRLPDMSCNWGRFSIPDDIRYREHGRRTDGCYAITVETVHYKSFATPCHAPLCRVSSVNYSHVEARELYTDEPATNEPEKGRKKRRKALRGEWKTNIVNNLNVLIPAQEIS